MPDENITDTASSVEGSPSSSAAPEASKVAEIDDDEAVVREVNGSADEKEDEVVPPRMKSVIVDEWIRLNPHPPLWMRCVFSLPAAFTPFCPESAVPAIIRTLRRVSKLGCTITDL